MRKKFITNLAFILFLNLLIKPFWIFGIDRVIQNTVGTNEYGFYFSLFNFSLLLNIVLDLGITNYNNRNISRHNQLLDKYFSNIIGLKFMLGIVYLVFILISALIIDYSQKQIYFLLLLTFNQFLISLILYMRSNISALHMFKIDSIISVLDRTILIIICGILLLDVFNFGIFQIEWLVMSQSVAYILTALFAFFVILSKSKKLTFKFDFKFFIIILKKSYPYALLVLLMTSYTRIDSVMLERMLPDGNTQVGIYAHGYRILDAASQYAYLFAALLLPIFAKMLKNNENVSKLVKLSLLLLIIPAFALSVSSFFYSQDIIFVLYKNHIEISAQVFSILILGFIPISSSYIFGTLLTANGSLKELNILAVISLALNITLNLILIPEYKALGAATASLATLLFMAVAQVFIARKKFNFTIKPQILIKLFLFVVLVTITAFLADKYIEHRILGFSSVMLSAVVLAFAMQLINIKFLYKIVKYDL